MKKITNKFLLCIILIGISFFSVGCSNEDPMAEEGYVNSELKADNLYEEAQKLAEETLLGNSTCVITRDMSNTEDTVIKAPVALLINRTDNICMYMKNPFKKMYPASLTKVVTALGAYNLSKDMKNETVTVSKQAASITESGAKLCGFKEGDQIKLYDLIVTMLVYSGNDAAMSVAEHILGSENDFCKKVTDISKTIGATQSNFVNGHGLHNDNHYTTAYDMYLIFDRFLEYKDSYTVAGEDEFVLEYTSKDGTANKKTFDATNKYLIGSVKAPDGVTVLAGKTGTTNKAGNCLILVSKGPDDKEYISVVLNAPSSTQLYQDMTNLLSYIK
ncbi:MAG: D-alanyl-D-alanine carboxypeptidase [Lachnospiraceae bacterium]|nr:D-alanyl-D-alanine carboxypeptidase [Lachnospiraceae bacterium]